MIKMEENFRNTHTAFFAERNWDLVASFWSTLMTQSAVPQFIAGDALGGYGLTDLKSVSAIGMEEFASNDPRFKRQTFAIRIGYDGPKYNGYQRQKGLDNFHWD